MNSALLEIFGIEREVDWKILASILMVESGGKGFYANGNIKKRYEPGIYAGLLRKKQNKITRILPGLKKSWVAKHSEEQLSLMSTSYGIAQIMGWHYPALGYQSVEEMVRDYSADEDNQTNSFLKFVTFYRYGKFLKALKDLDYKKIAIMYNGAGYKRNGYDKKLKYYYSTLENEYIPLPIDIEPIGYGGPTIFQKTEDLWRRYFKTSYPV